MNYEFNLLYYIGFFKRWWKVIAFTVVISMVLTAAIASKAPTTYVSRVTLVSSAEPPSGSTTASLGRFLGISPMYSSGAPIVALVKSRCMQKDIIEHFGLEKKPKFRWEVDTSTVNECMEIVVRGSEPALVQKIASFAVENLNKINEELDLTPKKPMVKVLDCATYGSPRSKQIPKKIFVSGILAFLLISVCGFLVDYINRLKHNQTAKKGY